MQEQEQQMTKVTVSDKLAEIQANGPIKTKKNMNFRDAMNERFIQWEILVAQQDEELDKLRHRVISVSLALDVLMDKGLITQEEIDESAQKLITQIGIQARGPDSVEDKDDAGEEGLDSPEHGGEQVSEGVPG